LALFTDGGCRGNPGPGAWGFVIQDHKATILAEESDSNEHTTNNQMEMLAVLEGLNWIAEFGHHKQVRVYSDSTYVVKGMNEWVQGWKARGWKKADKKAPDNLEIWQKLDAKRDEFESLEFYWVKGHAGHPQNERCDQLVNQALDEAGY